MGKDLSRTRRKAPGHYLATLHRLSAAYLSPRMKQLGVKRGWISMLVEILEQPGRNQEALRDAVKVDRAAAARTLFELEGEGYATRREDPADRRQKLADPGEKALALASNLFSVLDEHNDALFKGFGPARREEALGILRDMAANLEDAVKRDDA